MVNGKAHTLCGNSNRQGTGRRFSHVCTATCDGTSYNRLGKNMDDGSVSMELQGTEGAVEGLERLIRTGNYFIRVKTFSLEACAVCPDEKRFVIRY